MADREPTAVPTVFGDDMRAETVANAIMHAQQQVATLDVQRRLNGDEPSDPIPGAEPKPGQTEPQTYAQRKEQLEGACRLLMEDNADVREEIEAVASRWRAERDQKRALQTPEQGR